MKEKGRDLASTINIKEVCAECERLNRHLKWMVSFVSHELSSTLGTIVMNISALADTEVAKRLDKDKQKRMMLGALSSLNLMQDMVRNYLASTKVKDGQLSFNPTKLNLDKDIISKIVKRLMPALKMKGMAFICEHCSDLEVVCDKSLIHIAIKNLINNAIKYGSINTTIRSSLRKWHKGFNFTITSEGIGIPEDKLEAIFDEFARFDPLGIGGTGLGLYLVRKIATMHNGNIKANAGYILSDKFITYEMARKNPDQYTVDLNDERLRKFATFVLRIPGCTPTESGLKAKKEN